MTKYLETMNVEPTTTKTIFVEGGDFSWSPQGDRLAKLGVVEVPQDKKPTSTASDGEKRTPKR
jgi:hypothetical protein